MTKKLDFSKLNLQDALDLAILIEEEAEERYREFAEMLGGRYEGDAADVFRKMEQAEAKHGRELGAKRQQLFKNAGCRVDRSMIWDVEAPDYASPRSFMSPRQAARLALSSEVKAYEFFDGALKFVKDPEVKALFEELRGEEVDHQKMIQALIDRLPPGEGPDKDDDDVDEPPAL